MKIWTLILLVVFGIKYGKSQDTTNLLLKIKQAPDDSSKVKLLLKLGGLYNNYLSIPKIEEFKNALGLSKKLAYNSGVNNSYVLIINTLYYREQYDHALTYCLEYKDFAELSNNKQFKSLAYFQLGNLLCKQGKFRESLTYHHLSKKSYLELTNEYMYARSLVSIAYTHLIQKNNDSAEVYLKKSVVLFKRSNKISEFANSLLGISEIMLDNKNYATAIENANEALNNYSVINLKLGMANAHLVLAKVFYETSKLDSVNHHLNNALLLNKQLSVISSVKECYQLKVKFFAKTKLFDSAFYYSQLLNSTNDSLSKLSSKFKMDNSYFKYNLNKTETELITKNEIITLKEKQNNLLILFVLIVLLFLIVLLVFFRQKIRANKKIEAQKKEIEEKQTEILASIRYAKRIQQSLLPTSKYINRIIKK